MKKNNINKIALLVPNTYTIVIYTTVCSNERDIVNIKEKLGDYILTDADGDD